MKQSRRFFKKETKNPSIFCLAQSNVFCVTFFVKLFFVKKKCVRCLVEIMVFCKIFFYFLDNIFFTQKWAKFNL